MLSCVQDVGTLKVSGYVRSRALSVNKLVHVTGVGDFQLLQVSGCVHNNKQCYGGRGMFLLLCKHVFVCVCL